MRPRLGGERPGPARYGLERRPDDAHDGVALLGWMERDAALRFLLDDCVSVVPFTERSAEALWQSHRTRAEALNERQARAPELLPLTAAEEAQAQRFAAFRGQAGAAPAEVVKLDPMQLIAGQYYVAVDRAEQYGAECATDEGWLASALPASLSNPELSVRVTKRMLDTDIDIDLPHAEFTFGMTPQGAFGPIQSMGHVSVVRAGERMVLTKGYHRLYARLARANAHPRPTVFALDSGSLPGEATAHEWPGLNPFGTRPALFSDFFDDAHAARVYLRKKRYQLQIRAKWVALDAEPGSA
ncbi:MAG: hypothetical protein WB615_01535 [Candidatus Tumulicola sp.]